MTALEIMKSIKDKPVRETCKRGHPLNSITTYEHPRGYITCKVCTAGRVRAYYQRNKDSIKAHKRWKGAA